MKGYIKIFIAVVLVASIIGFFVFGEEYTSIQYILEQRDMLSGLYDKYPIQTLLIFILVYIFLVTISFSGATVLTLLGGLLFGTVIGTIAVSISSTIGAVMATVLVRFAFIDLADKYFGKRIKKVVDFVNENGTQYLFALRLAPIFPFFLVNIAMAFTSIGLLRYAVITMIGAFPATVIYVYAGSQLASIDTLADIVSFEIIVALFLLAGFPFVIKYIFKDKKWYNKSISN